MRVVVLDNLKEGVLTPDIYDPALNPLYRDVLAHYGVVALPCRVRDPDRKGKVEAAVGHAQKTPLRGRRFERLDDGQAYLDRWEQRWADTRIHGTTKRQVAAMFEEERPALGPLPLEPFRYPKFNSRSTKQRGISNLQRQKRSSGTTNLRKPGNGSVRWLSCGRLPVAGRRRARRRWPAVRVRPAWRCARAGCARRGAGRWR